MLVEATAQTNPYFEKHLRDLAAIAEETTDAIIITDEKGVIAWVNNGATRMFGLDWNEITGTPLTGFFQNNLSSPAKVAEIKSTLKKRGNFAGTLLCRLKNGSSVWNEMKIKGLRDRHGVLLKFIVVARDVTEHIRKNEELLYSELKWKFALEESGDGFFEYDLVNHKFFGSPNLQALVTLNEDSTQVVFPALINIIHNDDTELAVNALFDLITGNTKMLQQELRLKNKQGNYVWTNVRATVSSMDTEGRPLMLIGTTTDISQIKETEEELLMAKLEAEKASEYKNQFLSTMSHEIRTPLNAIIGLTDVMLMQKPKGELKENLNILSFSAHHLLSLINDVLDLAKIESGKIEFVASKFNLNETIKRIYQTFQPRCKENGIELVYTIDKSTPVFVSGDELRLTQIMNNLVSNAVKFTAKGSVKIFVRPLNTLSNKVKLLFEVIDTGIGIEKKKQQQIFEDFVQADSKISHQYGGTGLGLAITKKLIELQGGCIRVESKPGKGSRFYFELELGCYKIGKANIKKPGKYGTRAGNLQNIQVLLVEDILANRKVAAAYLNHWKAEVKCAENGIEALKLFKKYDFDILLIDLYMPGMNGFEAIQKIRQLPKGKTVSIVALTASIETSVIKKALDCGADICIGKPFEPRVLLETIQKLSSRPLAVPSAITNKPKTNRFKYINLKLIEDASLGDKAFIKDMITLLKREIPATIEACEGDLKRKDYPKF